ncbi:MAG TPA: dihydropyrimidine dehydrogenase, partial [Candidatus Atribacteria bacterium]|nr:dihydropyrimidine dehydrogenase [Candidatus Atribacteria bacterium]
VTRTAPQEETKKWGYFLGDEKTKATPRAGIFAGGDIVRGSVTLISAVGYGKLAARAIDKFLSLGKSLRKK